MLSVAAFCGPSKAHVPPRVKECRKGLHFFGGGAVKSHGIVVAIFALCPAALKVCFL